jgi:hypothetical protein
MSKDEWALRRDAWRRALQEIATECGKDSAVYKILDTMAWGRFDGEGHPGETRDDVAYGVGFLHGARLAVARDVADVLATGGDVRDLAATIFDLVREAGPGEVCYGCGVAFDEEPLQRGRCVNCGRVVVPA